ncbi:MAG TPA: septum formation initiator family protein [Candidatus Paceibacterota bacterium]|jgi:cell division protein FtsB|nr:septum formation initiator family protein [Candidatus Paceibacterota bacterium]
MARRRVVEVREYVIVAILALALVWLAFLTFGIARKEEIARHAVKDTQAQLAQLDARRATLQQNISDLSTNRGQEAVLRQTYGVAKPGEEVIIVVPPKDAPPPPALSWWQKMQAWFGF